VYLSARICERFLETTLPAGTTVRDQRLRLAIAALEDHHLLGMHIVGAVARSAGYRVADYGSLTVAGLVARAVTDRVDVLLVSVLMLHSALRVRDLRDGLRAAGSSATIVVGGAPFRLDPDLWREVGADAVGGDATDALAILRRLEEATA
jgi:trimethylamine corrinoid protein